MTSEYKLSCSSNLNGLGFIIITCGQQLKLIKTLFDISMTQLWPSESVDQLMTSLNSDIWISQIMALFWKMS